MNDTQEIMELYGRLHAQMPPDRSDNTSRIMLAALAMIVATIIKRRFPPVVQGVELAKFEILVKQTMAVR